MTNEEAIKIMSQMIKDEEEFLSDNTVEAHKMAIKALEQTTWTLCNERLPNEEEYRKNNGMFNVTDGNRSYFEWFNFYDRKGFGEPTINGFRIDKCVIAWMPLPEPYKGE